MSSSTNPKPNRNLPPGFKLEVPGIKLSIGSIPALLTFAVLFILLSLLIAYLITSKNESVTSVIRSLNPKSETTTTQRKVNQVLSFWVPSTPEYQKNMQTFEEWLSANNGWWSRTAMRNIRTIEGKKIPMDGYLYSLQDPVENSEVANDGQRAVQNQAVKLLGISDLNMIWTEISMQELAP